MSLPNISTQSQVSFRLELTTPACPIKDMVNETQPPLFDQELMCVSSGTYYLILLLSVLA